MVSADALTDEVHRSVSPRSVMHPPDMARDEKRWQCFAGTPRAGTEAVGSPCGNAASSDRHAASADATLAARSDGVPGNSDDVMNRQSNSRRSPPRGSDGLARAAKCASESGQGLHRSLSEQLARARGFEWDGGCCALDPLPSLDDDDFASKLHWDVAPWPSVHLPETAAEEPPMRLSDLGGDLGVDNIGTEQRSPDVCTLIY